ncbi:MAG TPA: sigma factor-like helix-turn-helix DNA-binding protein [Gaiellaceae bacterium]|jgi:RNA polymerase sigma-70 factor (ECF subfamily)|nr:sigma factor-like helix-turn-helix DNA-binding protein [Gaiellaceae bacterium]
MAGIGREADALSLRCVLLLEQLPPVERSAFLLHHVFGRSRAETARIVGVSEAKCQHLLLRVQSVMSAAKPGIEAERKERHDVTSRFVAGVRAGDVDLLAELLALDAVAYVDTTQTPTVGRRAVARLLARLSGAFTVELADISLEVGGGLVQTVRVTLSQRAGLSRLRDR